MKKNCRKGSSRTMLGGLSLLLVMTTLLMLCAGCGSGSAALSSAEETTSAANSVADSVVVDAVQSEATAEVSTVEEASVDEPESIRQISYPLEGGATLTYWYPYNANLVQGFMDSWYDNLIYSQINELTGVTLDYISPSSTAASEQFKLMIASGEYPDLMNVVDNYEGGAVTALEQDVIVDLTDLVEENAPDYLQKLSTLSEISQKEAKEDQGRLLAIYGINNDYQQDSGLTIRKDWLDELGLDVPETVDELYDCMMAVKAEYSPKKLMDTIGSINHQYIVGAFGIAGMALTVDGFAQPSNIGVYIGEDGKTLSSTIQSDGYREYIEYVTKCYANGLIDTDFYTVTGFGASAAEVAGGDVFIFKTRSDSFPSIYSQVESDENFELLPIPCIVHDKGDSYEFGDIPAYLTNTKVSVSTACQDVELALQYLNWFFTDDAFIITNFGEEGVSFEYDENNVPNYTELLTNNELANLATIRMLYCFQFLPLYLAQDAVYRAGSEQEHQALEVWSQMDYSRTAPTLSYTEEESAIRAKYMTDLISRTAEVVTTWVIGQAELNDETWADFQEELIDLGVEEVMAAEQTAFDRYMTK